jgi:hypothetical protein
VEIVNFASNITPLSTSYIGDDDILFNGILDKSEDDILFYREDYLKNGFNKINNYSSLCLTDKKKMDDFITLKTISDEISDHTFSTTLINIVGEYLVIDSNPDINNGVLFKNDLELAFSDLTNTIFEVTLLDDIRVKISHKSKNRDIYYLTYDESNDVFVFSNIFNDSGIFNYVLDKENNKLSLLKAINDELKCLVVDNKRLKLDSTISSFKSNFFVINYYIQKLNPKLNTSWVSYKHEYKNAYDVNSDKSIKDLENNILVTTQYSYVTGNTLESNILVLKNQKTHKNYSYRSDYLEKNQKNVPVVDNRRYYGIFAGNEQEKGDYSIILSYEFYNSDYKFVSDKHTIFKTPETLYPYEKININDLNWNNRGSIAGENPHTSDKIFKNKISNKLSGGEYLCSWLKKEKNGDSVWLDRYYYPDKTTFAKALESPFTYDVTDSINQTLQQKLSSNEYYDVPFVYNSLEEELEHTPQTVKDAIYGKAFFDKKSDLILEPNSEYIYHRLGNDYVLEILNAIKGELLINGLDLKNSNNASILIEGDVDSVEYDLNNNSYSRIENYSEINKSHQFTICFWMKSDDWSKGFGHQILGNLNDKGFALLDDEKITPLITIQSNREVYVYNTDFALLDKASLLNEEANRINNSRIKDIYRSEHLNSYYTINID